MGGEEEREIRLPGTDYRLRVGDGGGLGASPFQIQGEEEREDFFFGEIGRPAIGGGDGGIQRGMGVCSQVGFWL